MACSVLPVSPQEATRLKRQAQESAVRDCPVLSFIPVLRTVISKRSWNRDSVDKTELNYVIQHTGHYMVSVHLFKLALFFKKTLKVATTVHICSFLATLFRPKLEYLHKKDLTEYLVQLHIFVNEEMEIYPQSFKRNLLSGIHSIQELAYLGVTDYSLHLFLPFRLGKYRLLKMLYAQKNYVFICKTTKEYIEHMQKFAFI